VDVGTVDLRVAGRADGPDRVSLGDGRVLADCDRTEVRERDGEAVRGRDRDGVPRAGDGAGERDRSGRGSQHGLAGAGADVDPPVLPTRVRMVRIEGERLQDAAAHRPRPGARHRREQERGSGRDEKKTTHGHHLGCRGNGCSSSVAAAGRVVKRGYKVGTRPFESRYRVRR
jgi:hypothetical protein